MERYAKKDARKRGKAKIAARKRAGLSQADIDAQYRAALERNPLANRSGGRGGARSHTSDEESG